MTFISQTSQFTSTPDLVLVNVPCDPSVLIGDWVRMDLLGVAYQALADNINNSNVIGLVEFKSTSTLCNIRVLGVSEPLFVGLDPTKEYFLSNVVAGGMIIQGPTVPSAPGEVLLKVGQPFSSTRILVLKGQRIQRS